MNLLKLYEAVLNAAWLKVSEDGYVSRDLFGESAPFMVECSDNKTRRLVLPTKEHVRNPEREQRVNFHPLAENIMRGPSDIVEAYRAALNSRINASISLLTVQLLVLASSPAEHGKLTPDQSEFLSHVKDAVPDNANKKGPSLPEKFEKLIDAMPIEQTQKCFATFFVKRSATLEGKAYKRGGIVSFPFYQELISMNEKVYGVSFGTKERKVLKQLMEYMFPGIDQANSYSRGSNSDVAPTLDALMKAVMAVGSRINDLVDLFENVLDSTDLIRINDDWVETFQDLSVMLPQIREIPPQFGNEGASTLNDQARTALPTNPVQTATTPGQAAQPSNGFGAFGGSGNAASGQPPASNPQPSAPASSGGAKTMAEIMANHPSAQTHAAYMQQQYAQMMAAAGAAGVPFGVRPNMPANNQAGMYPGFGQSSPFGWTGGRQF